ncbi:MAG: SprB repeat-containing protein [Bacteroidetes bacterium]|nr:SprB repeat-containing protein [Bacteroidota bacterium]
MLATGSGVTISSSQDVYITSYNTTTQCESFIYQIVNVTITPTFAVTPSNPNNVAYNGFGVSCKGSANGAITATITSVANPYTYFWSNGSSSGFTNSATHTISGLVAGTYTVSVFDAGGCNQTATFSLSEPAAISVNATLSTSTGGGFNINCNGGTTGTITPSVTNGIGAINYDWADLAGTNNGANRTALSANTYTLTITDANGCTASKSFTLTAPSPLLVTVNRILIVRVALIPMPHSLQPARAERVRSNIVLTEAHSAQAMYPVAFPILHQPTPTFRSKYGMATIALMALLFRLRSLQPAQDLVPATIYTCRLPEMPIRQKAQRPARHRSLMHLPF